MTTQEEAETDSQSQDPPGDPPGDLPSDSSDDLRDEHEDQDGDEQIEQYLDETTVPSPELNGDGAEQLAHQDQDEDEVPPIPGLKNLGEEGLKQVILTQRDQISDLMQRVSQLEHRQEDLLEALGTVEKQQEETDRVIQQLNSGTIGGEQGAELLFNLAAPPGNTIQEAYARQVYKTIVEERRVGDWIYSSSVRDWTDVDHYQQAHRVMDRLERLCQTDRLPGVIQQSKRRNQRVIRLTGTDPDGDDRQDSGQDGD